MLTSAAFFDGAILTRKTVSESLELSFRAGLLPSLFWALSLSRPPHSSGSVVFDVGSKVLTSGPYTAIAGALPAESQPQHLGTF